VRSPLGRLTPKAAHNKSESVCIGSERLEYARVERRRLSAESNGCPPSRRGAGSGIAFISAAEPNMLPVIAALAKIPATVSRRVII
jgi:hypothetical protein